MAARNVSHVVSEDSRVIYTWSGLLNGDNGNAGGINGRVRDFAFQVSGTFGVGGSVALQGSQDNVNWLAMEDEGGTTIAATTTKVWRLSRLPRFVRPLVTAGDGTTTLVAVLSGNVGG